MALNCNNNDLTGLEAGPRPPKRLTLDGNAVPGPQNSVTDGESDGSIFEVFSDQYKVNDSTLCSHCQHVCDNWSNGFNDADFVFPHWADIFQLEESAAAGCAMCAQFLLSATENEIQEAKDVMKQQLSASFDARVSFSILKNFRTRERSSLYLKYLLPHDLDGDEGMGDDLHREIIELSVVVIPDNSSDPVLYPEDHQKRNTRLALPMVSRWLRRCRKSHWQCNFRRDHIAPSRLVSTREGSTRLFLRNDFQSTPEYATLSHCWGKMEFVTLNTQNLNEFRKRIPDSALSQTFKDAIVIARELGLAYIWIDSLCILQNNADDWSQEAATMSSVYGCSSLNIAASGAPDGSFGCFLEPKHTLECHIQVKLDYSVVHYQCVPGGMYSRFLSDMPLMKRGWTLQERLLAPRTLHFTSTQVYWECHQNVTCEMFPEKFPLSLAYANSYLQKQPVSRSMWSWIIERYSGTRLTCGTDKLVAISGIAREVQMQTRDQYVAGMWRKDLEFQLCWYNAVSQQCQRVVPYRAPTWSWASLDSLIDCSIAERFGNTRANTRLWIQVLDVQLQFTGADALGQLTSANLRLGCTYLFHIAFQTESENDYMNVAGEMIKVIIHLDEGGNAKLRTAIALPVFGSSDIGHMSGLIIEPTKQMKGQYRRLGDFRFYKSKYCEQFEAASTKRGCWVRSSELYKIRTDKFGKIHRIINLV